MRELVLGAMPFGALPSTHIASGSWCFSGRENFFPDWDNTKNLVRYFPLPDDPFYSNDKKSQGTSLTQTALTANNEVDRLIDEIGNELNEKLNVQYSCKFWTMALGPWLLLATHMMVERQQRIVDLIDLYRNEPLTVNLLPPDCSFSFSTLLDFMIQGVQGREFNQYVFSRIIESTAPCTWKVVILPTQALRPPLTVTELKKDKNIVRCSKQFIADYLRLLPFPFQKGFPLWQCIRLSLAVLRNDNPTDNSTAFASYAGSNRQVWKFDAKKIIRSTMPCSLSKMSALPPVKNTQHKLRGMTAAITQDDSYRLCLALWVEGGGKLFSVQHGANYGNLSCIGGSIFEYMQHAFITWGWKKHNGYICNAVALPQPQFSLPLQSARTNNTSLILVGTEMSPYSYRLKSRPSAKAQVLYRQAKVRFFCALPDNIRRSSLYRPYFTVQNGLADASYVTEKLPDISLAKGNLFDTLKNSKLAVLDHYGTTMLSCIGADIPFLCYWKPTDWGFDQTTQKGIELLRQAGILYDEPEKAARTVEEIWECVHEWWNDSAKNLAINYWKQHYCLGTQGNIFSIWADTLQQL